MVAHKVNSTKLTQHFISLLLLVALSFMLVVSGPHCLAATGSASANAYADSQGTWRYDNTHAAWRYLGKSGGYATDTWLRIDDTYYCFDSNGYMRTGWISSGERWYYCTSSGAMATGWKRIHGAWYYLAPNNGAMATNWQRIDGTWYYFAPSGAMQTGWQNIGGRWYYLSSSGAMQTGWLHTGDAWYYLNSSGTMATGWRSIDGDWYHFGSSGVMDRGWLQEGSSWYYLQSSGKAAKEWVKIGGAWYYFFPSSCRMAANQFIDHSWVNSSGVWDATKYDVEELIRHVNQARNRAGLPTLKWSDSLANTAALRAREAADYFSHTRPNGESCFSIYPSGLKAIGENLAAGPSTVAEAHQGWMNSPSHRACILDKDFNVMGAACIGFDDGYNYYWVESFGYDPNL